MSQKLLDRARILAIRGDFAHADEVVQSIVDAVGVAGIMQALNKIGSDCQKVGVDSVMYWSARWMLKLDPASTPAHIRVMIYHERQGSWPSLAKAMDDADAQVPADNFQRPLLNRHMARLRRKLGDLVKAQG